MLSPSLEKQAKQRCTAQHTIITNFSLLYTVREVSLCILPAATISWQQCFAGNYSYSAGHFWSSPEPKVVAQILKWLGTSVPAVQPFCNSVENLHTLFAAYFLIFTKLKSFYEGNYCGECLWPFTLYTVH